MANKPYVNKSQVLKIDASQVEGLRDRLAKVRKEEMGSVIRGVVNSVADAAYQNSRRELLSTFNTSPDRFDQRFALKHATKTKPDAQIVAAYGGDALSHFKPEQRAVVAKSPKHRLKGDPTRGIALGDKQRAVSIEVRRGDRKDIGLENVFLAPAANGRRDSEGNLFVFQRIGGRTRTGKTKLRRLFGPSPYQMFGRWIPKNDEALTDEMQETLVERIDDWLEKEVFS